MPPCRCRVIPLVSRAFRHAHDDHLPHPKAWAVTRQIDPSMVGWFRKIAASLEEVIVLGPHYSSSGLVLLPAMLAMAAMAAPNLRHLTIGGHWGDIPVMHSLVFLSQVKELTLQGWAFNADTDGMEMERLSGLRSLEVRDSLLQYLCQVATRSLPLSALPYPCLYCWAYR